MSVRRISYRNPIVCSIGLVRKLRHLNLDIDPSHLTFVYHCKVTSTRHLPRESFDHRSFGSVYISVAVRYIDAFRDSIKREILPPCLHRKLARVTVR